MIPLILLVGMAGQAGTAEGDGKPASASELRFEEMQRRAKATHVSVLRGKQRTRADRTESPLFRYSDQPRGILDATFWLWKSGGRPVAFQKVELYRNPNKPPTFFYCFASLSKTLIESEWDVGMDWKAKAPGVALLNLANGPKPGRTASGRIRQLKQTARRFSVTYKNLDANTQNELRFLTQPMHRYANKESGLVDGAIFGFATNGTNPDALLLLEMHRGVQGSSWKYGWVQMTQGGLEGKLDRKTVWKAPFRANVPFAKFDNWMYFQESAARKPD